MKFSDLAKEVRIEAIKDFDISLITSDSRKATKQSVFFLLPRADLKFAKMASDKGAVVIHDRSDLSVGFKVECVHLSFTKALQIYFKDSFSNLNIYGVTGTNGKTSFSFMLKTMFESYDQPTGIFGTIGNFFENSELKTDLTSPTAEDFYSFNHQNFKRGMKNVVCEVSSHALDQKRLGVKFLSGAAFTSFSQDHLDYHANMSEYLEAKKKISFESLKDNGFLVGHEHIKEFGEFKSKRKISIGGSKYSFEILESSIKGISIDFKKGSKSIKGLIPMLGDFNAENFALALTVLCEHFGADFFPDSRVFESFRQIPGRMEGIDLSSDSVAFIDFSHTPDSLKKSLETLKLYSHGRKLIVVFGCGGDRDKTKRPLMGKIATDIADEAIITSDNPRFEDPNSILEDITQNLDKEKFVQKLDRAESIKYALEIATREPSVILIAGKGHEEYQDLNGVKSDFSDRDQVFKWLASR